MRGEHHANRVLNFLETDTIEGTDEPFRVYAACGRVLAASGNARARDFLISSYDRLRQWANSITSASQRRAFLKDMPFHRNIVAAISSSSVPNACE